ncbi:hypothetical protein PsorP6_015591 [Peronosclerospora sorghi]|uniref:Uncharacterized protein n=1 Tax=Peronosclerospora sorghi TaxID=230839 RepID=A0ACC0WMR2_9STRA|nr:hypothetical protein PsorP6_015591 [Peronosclerospora sorghi]
MADGQDVQTLKMKAARKHDEHERRRPATLEFESSLRDVDVRKSATSFLRARTSGVHRLLRSSPRSSSARSHEPSDGRRSATSAPSSHTQICSHKARRSDRYASRQADEHEHEQPPPSSSSLVVVSPRDSDGLDPERLSLALDHAWTHVVLKMTAFSDDDAVTSFHFDTRGGGIGRSDANVARIPADTLLSDTDHARILYTSGRFYLVNGENTSGTFVRLSPCSDDASGASAVEDRMQWPLDPHVSFRVGKSDFVVTDFNALTTTLDVSALSGKLAGTHFTIGRDGAGIGRSAENHIHTSDGELSRKHAAIWFDDLTHQFYLVDLHSTNGTFMKLVASYHEPYRLEIGDDLLVAQTCLTVHRFDFGAHADMGARKHMEDAHTIVQDLCIESLSRLGFHPQSFFAVYDGHGGDEASSFLADVLHHNVIQAFDMNTSEWQHWRHEEDVDARHAMITQRLTTAFERTDAAFLAESDRPQAGSTATTVLVAGHTLFVANVGDSRTVLSRAGLAERLSHDHKPSRADEAQRIRDTGGFVIHGRIMGELAVSRAFGDAPFKAFEGTDRSTDTTHDGDESGRPRSEYDSQELPVDPNEMLKGPLVIPTPEVTVTELTDDCEFVLLASDGLYDVLKDQEAVDFLRHKMQQLGDVQRAVERSTDNVTCVVVLFKDAKTLK